MEYIIGDIVRFTHHLRITEWVTGIVVDYVAKVTDHSGCDEGSPKHMIRVRSTTGELSHWSRDYYGGSSWEFTVHGEYNNGYPVGLALIARTRKHPVMFIDSGPIPEPGSAVLAVVEEMSYQYGLTDPPVITRWRGDDVWLRTTQDGRRIGGFTSNTETCEGDTDECSRHVNGIWQPEEGHPEYENLKDWEESSTECGVEDLVYWVVKHYESPAHKYVSLGGSQMKGVDASYDGPEEVAISEHGRPRRYRTSFVSQTYCLACAADRGLIDVDELDDDQLDEYQRCKEETKAA